MIPIDAEHWPIAAGCIGLARLYSETELPRTSTGILFNEKILTNLADTYIRNLIKEFSVVQRDVKRLEWYAHQAEKKPEQTKQYSSEVRNIMKEQYKKVKKYFPQTEECISLDELIENVKNIKSPEDAPKISEAIDQYEKIMQKPFINERLTLNYVKAVILKPFFGQTSILQPSFNSKNTEEHIQQIEKDFIVPANLELLFSEKRKEASTKEEILSFLEEYQTYKPFKNLLKVLKKLKSKEEIDRYLQNEVLPCSFIDGLLATQSFEEMVFSPLSFSKQKAVNFNWNFDKKLPVPISAVARLIMFLAPYGMAFYSRIFRNGQVRENLQFAGVILSQKHFAEVIKENITYKSLRSGGSSFEEAIVGLLSESIDKAKKINNSYYFIEVYSDYESKKTLLDYYHMPPYLVQYLSKYGKSLMLLKHKDIKDLFFRTVLKGIDPKENIFDYLRESIVEPIHAKGAFNAIRERRRILEAKKGGNDMKKYDNTINYVYFRGVDLQKEIATEQNEVMENAPYRASGRKKIESIAYRLLNATKAGNKNAFMDTIFRVHMAAGLEVPSIFVDCFKEDGLDFETIASAFIAGMLSEENRPNLNKGDVVNG